MLIPCIDVMEGKVVQLVGGEKKALEFDDPEPWLQKFAGYPLVHVVDLDAAMRSGSNRDLIARIVKRLPCQVGGGVRTANDARQLLDLGAQRIVVGSALVTNGSIDRAFAAALAHQLTPQKLVFSLDAKRGALAISGWKETVSIRAVDAIPPLEDYCSAFLYTNVDKEGSMRGFSIEQALPLRAATKRQLIVGGGIDSLAQVEELDSLGVDAVVGMAVYTGRIAVSKPLL